MNSTLILSDTISIFLPDSINHLGNTSRPFHNIYDNQFSYSTVDEGTIEIVSYNYRTDFWSKTTLYTTGPNQVYSEGAYSFINEKEFLFLPVIAPYIFKINTNGSIIKKYQYAANPMLAVDSKIKSSSVDIHDGKIYFDLAEYADFNITSTYENVKTIGVYDLTTGDFSKIINFPEEYHGRLWSSNDSEHSFVVRENKIYMNFSKSKFVYVYDLNGNLLTKKIIGNSKIRESKGKRGNDIYQDALDQLNNGHYLKIIYDKWRNVFYRIGTFVDIQTPINDPQEFAKVYNKKKISITTFDANLKVVANDEFFALQERINENYLWVREDGLYIYAIPTEPTESNYYFRKIELKELDQ
ncbi:DUF4221 family protein [Roseivirga sp. UBA1976]|uniref:DUF4221 family protein n=1 Tax=Roseivirga sp. UBA1976 TaxID=1947386 RepID=UPI002580CC31|nr:DUF4221 family protein [Roseivirga sp. UBA1976]MEC7752569.1 DUF4221 family protein [Bacteroidota bacterium]